MAIEIPFGRSSAEGRISAEERPNGISIAKARALIGYDPQRSWRDYLEDGGARPASSAGAG